MLRESLPKIVTASVPGEKAQAVINRKVSAIAPPLAGNTYPIVINRGEGAMVEDIDGNVFVDFIGGVGVLNIGYSHPEVVEAVKAQADNYFHTMLSIITHDGYVSVCEKLNELMPCRGDVKKSFLVNSGAEADENAIKVAKAYTKRSNIICFTGAFHGRTNLMMELTANKTYAKGMGPFPAGIYRAEYPYLYRAPKGYTEEEAIAFYIEKLQMLFKEGTPANEVAAVIVEPLQGEGGFIPAPIAWVKALRQICDDNGILIIADEVQSGNCRTGKYFGSQYWAEAGAAPDIITTAKSLGAGVPISALTARVEIMDSIPGGTIGGTYCGNPLACASALKVMEVMQRDDFAGKANHIADIVNARYAKMMEKYDVIGNYRGLGAMIGVEFVKDRETKEPYGELVSAVVQDCLQHGLLVESCGLFGNCIRFLAPLVITDEQLNAGLDILDAAIGRYLAK
ncbi:aspartate aminotransferase family protein [Bengtsoniella intestinalis]|uniref:aspartate aminotransferase family protein n=1 Tax=Bengtsoniella intestinalis TaxID=3073143 RepID=UPI00391F868C